MPTLYSPQAYHLLTYSTLLGSNLYQTFLVGPLSFSCLPRPQFATLQITLLPAFFSLQTALPVLLALTWPGKKIAGVGGTGVLRGGDGVSGLMRREEGFFWTALVPIAMMFSTSALNLILLGPWTTSIMRKRKHQGGFTSTCPLLGKKEAREIEIAG
ncbi:hypothetical protein LTR62_006296 [Meristemomyces frigidus]|uniref:TMEM205-like domain-containing protein n=1 Tax=Meristemomyces frigidus TaxID=1508187 RepID=A0AAN7TK05_9PEZI|nr:hypothetical protein LTR62_006296 [Meristemomyces frigidus]